MKIGYEVTYAGAALLLVLPPALSFIMLFATENRHVRTHPMDYHLTLCSGDRCTLDDCLCDCHRPGPRWFANVDRYAYIATRLILFVAVVYILAVILATFWMSRTV